MIEPSNGTCTAGTCCFTWSIYSIELLKKIAGSIARKKGVISRPHRICISSISRPHSPNVLRTRSVFLSFRERIRKVRNLHPFVSPSAFRTLCSLSANACSGPFGSEICSLSKSKFEELLD